MVRMTNPSTSQESQAGYQGSIASADLFVTLSNGSEIVCSLKDGKTTLFAKDESGQNLQMRNFEHLRNMRTEFPQFFQDLQRKLLNVVDFNGVDLPLNGVQGVESVDPNLGLLKDSNQASSMVNSTGGQGSNSIGPLTGYFEMATPVGSQRPESVKEESFHDGDAQESFSITAEANNLNLSGSEASNLNLSGSDNYFQQATPVSPSQRDSLSSFFHSEALSSPNTPERSEPQYQSSFEFYSSVTETERSLEREIDNSLLWGESSPDD